MIEWLPACASILYFKWDTTTLHAQIDLVMHSLKVKFIDICEEIDVSYFGV